MYPILDTRVECKVCLKIDVFNVAVLIRMLPEWNVKGVTFVLLFMAILIRMLPEWNVKTTIRKMYPRLYLIRMLPEWNVKVAYPIQLYLLCPD